MKTIAELIGKNIRARRESLGISQTALAKSAKISNITLNRIENGKQAPQGASLQMIADALNCTAEQLSQSRASGEKIDSKILSAIERGAATFAQKNLSPERQKLIALIPTLPEGTILQMLKLSTAALSRNQSEDDSASGS